MADKPPKQRCGAHARTTGKPCRNWAMPTNGRCRMHGGATPAWRQRERERAILKRIRECKERTNRCLFLLEVLTKHDPLYTAAMARAHRECDLHDELTFELSALRDPKNMLMEPSNVWTHKRSTRRNRAKMKDAIPSGQKGGGAKG